MYNKATYIKPYKTKIARALGIPTVDLKSNMVYAILANAKIMPIDHDQYGTPLYNYADLDAVVKSFPIIRDAYNKWKEDMIKQDVEKDMRIQDKEKKQQKQLPDKKYSWDNTAADEHKKEMQAASDQCLRDQEVYFDDEEDDRLYESLFSRKAYFTESQIKYIIEKIIDHPETAYVENDFGEKWKKLPIDSEIFNSVKEKIEFENHSKLELFDVCEVEGQNHLIAIVHGGLNGSGKWNEYLTDIYHFVQQLKDCWVIDLDIDVCDDVWTLTVGFEKESLDVDKGQLNEGAWGYKPDDSDTYWDLSDELGEMLFNKLIKDLEKFLKKEEHGNVYTVLGIITDLITCHSFNGELLLYYDDDITEKNEDKIPIKLMLVCKKAFKFLESDSENKQGWRDFDKYQKDLCTLHKTFINRMRLLNVSIKEKQKQAINESEYFIDPQKVLLVKRFLDDTFVRGNIPYVGDDGYPKSKPIVGMKGTDGNVAKNMDAQHLFYLLQDKFKGIYGDKEKRDRFLKQVMKDWYDRKITQEGLLSVNKY